MPTHLIPNDLILRMDKQKFYGEEKKTNININTNNDYSNEANSSIVNNNPVQHKIEKYKDFFYILKEDLKKNLDKNVQIAREIQEVEEERSYYLKKIKWFVSLHRMRIPPRCLITCTLKTKHNR